MGPFTAQSTMTSAAPALTQLGQPTTYVYEDPDPALLEWLGKDRASVTFRDLNDVDARGAAFADVIRQWIRHV